MIFVNRNRYSIGRPFSLLIIIYNILILIKLMHRVLSVFNIITYIRHHYKQCEYFMGWLKAEAVMLCGCEE